MGWVTMAFGTVKGIWQGVNGLLNKRSDRKTELAVIKAKADAKQSLTEDEVRRLMAEASITSYKDEFWCLVLALPWLSRFFAVWVPGLADAAQGMIDQVGQDNYVYMLGIAVTYSFGARWMRK